MKVNLRFVCLLVLLLLAVHRGWSATVTNLLVPSPAMKKDIPVTVILPDAYLNPSDFEKLSVEPAPVP